MREYPDGIIDYHVYIECMSASHLRASAQDQSLRIKSMRHLLVTRLPKWNYTLVRHFMCLFNHIAAAASVNKMDAHNISVCVAPSMFHKLDRPNDVESSFKAIAFVEFLINNTEALFGADTMSLLRIPAPAPQPPHLPHPPQPQQSQQSGGQQCEPKSTEDTVVVLVEEAASMQAQSRPAQQQQQQQQQQSKKEFGGRVFNLVSLKSRGAKGANTHRSISAATKSGKGEQVNAKPPQPPVPVQPPHHHSDTRPTHICMIREEPPLPPLPPSPPPPLLQQQHQHQHTDKIYVGGEDENGDYDEIG